LSDDVAPAAAPAPAPLAPADSGSLFAGLYNGQPISRAGAFARMEELRADPKFQERVAARDPDAFSEHTRLWRLAHGLSAEPQPPQSPVDVDVEADARVIAAVQQHAEHYANKGATEQQQIEIVGQRPVTIEERRWHQAQYERKRTDPEFMRRWSAGSRQEIEEMNIHAIGMRLPLGTLDDIRRWGDDV
jgi:hypothetical protein